MKIEKEEIFKIIYEITGVDKVEYRYDNIEGS